MVDYFTGTNIPLSYVPEDQRASFIADIEEAGGDTQKWKSTLYDIAGASGDPHKIYSGAYGLNTSIGTAKTGQGKTWAELSVSDPSGGGATDVYKKHGGGTVQGPEVGIPDVDIHGYPEGWTQQLEGNQIKITTADGHVYYKPYEGGGSGAGGGSGSGAGAGSGSSAATTSTKPMDMATLTSDMDLSNKLTEIINKNSPLFKAATTKAMQNMQRRGIVNSTLAQEAVMNSVISVAMPIAQQEVNNLIQNLYYNTDWTNKDKAMANEFAYNSMLTKLQGTINYSLQQLVGSQNLGLQTLKGSQAMNLQGLQGTQAIDLQTLLGQQETKLQQDKIKADLWAKYGDWITMMATAEGADQEAWQNMLDMLKGAGGWPLPT